MKDKILDAGTVPLAHSQILTAQLRNVGSRVAAFRVLPNPKLTVRVWA